MGCHRDPGGDCYGEWGCHDCSYNTPEAIEKHIPVWDLERLYDELEELARKSKYAGMPVMKEN